MTDSPNPIDILRKERRELRAKISGLKHAQDMINKERDAMQARVKEINASLSNDANED